MTGYPSESLAIVAPIVFIVLLVLFPLIGALAGWKRSLYWGIGNVAFYFIGILVWNLAGTQIIGLIKPLLLKVLPSSMGSADMSTLITSVVGPVFFILVMLVGNLLLLICYYAFVKRLMGIKKDKEARKEAKEKKYAAKVSGKQVVVKTKLGVSKSRGFNVGIGALSLGVLMLPVSLSLSNVVAMGTTSAATRQTNNLCNNVYNSLQSVVNRVGVCSYFNGGKAAGDFDGLFEVIGQTSNTVEYKIGDTTYTTDGMTALTSGVPNVVSTFVKDLNTVGEIKTEAGVDEAIKKFEQMQTSWNAIITGVGNESAGTILSSDGILDTVDSLIPGGSVELNSETIQTQILAENSMYNRLVEALNSPNAEGICTFKVELEGGQTIEKQIAMNAETIPVTEKALDRISETAVQMFKFDESVTDEQKEAVKIQAKQLVSMFITAKK